MLSLKHLIAIVVCLSATASTNAQTKAGRLTGKYTMRYSETSLQLFPDSTFSLTEPDFVFPYTFNTYRSSGTWTAEGNRVILNPEKEKRTPTVTLAERTLEGDDSITIKLNYVVEVFRNDTAVRKEPFNFELLTLYLNGLHHYRNIVHSRIIRVCSFAHQVKRQLVVDSGNEVRIPREKLDWLGIYTYGFSAPVKLKISNPSSNYLDVEIVQPVDEERVRRDKAVIIKGKRAYFYEWMGNVDTSIRARPLKRLTL